MVENLDPKTTWNKTYISDDGVAIVGLMIKDEWLLLRAIVQVRTGSISGRGSVTPMGLNSFSKIIRGVEIISNTSDFCFSLAERMKAVNLSVIEFEY